MRLNDQKGVFFMESLERAFYDLKFDIEFLTKTANEFQQFFNVIMSARYPGDFIATRTWGQAGDKKCDGYILSSGSFYQVYAPDELDAKSAVKKMKDDFSSALENWTDKIKTWVFVHNSKTGVPPHILQQLTDFKMENSDIEFTHMGKHELKSALFEVSDMFIREILGAVPTYQDVNNLSMESIKQTLLGIAKSTPIINSTIEPVSQEKLDANRLSAESKQLFEVGMIKSNLIDSFFKQWHDPRLEEKTAAEMNNIYSVAVSECIDSDAVFQRILTTINGTKFGDPSSTIAALTIMAYFFQTCDIFEQPR